MTDVINLGRDAAVVTEAPPQPAYTGVKLYVGKDDEGFDLYYFAGNEKGSVLEIENPWGSQTMANNILNAIKGYIYTPMQADDTLLHAAAEVGDAVAVNRVYSVIARRDTNFGALLVSNIAAPSDGELGHEYQYEEKQNRELHREISRATSSLIVDLNEIKGQVTDDQGNYTVVTIKGDGLYVGGASKKLDGSNIKSNTIGTTHIKGGSITTDLIASKAIQAKQIDTGAITTAKLAADAVTAAKIDSEAVRTDSLLLTGMVDFYNSSKKSSYASLGYGYGHDGKSPTFGAKLEASGGNYFIVTNAGARMTAGNSIYVTSGGCYCTDDMIKASDRRIKEDINDDMSVYKDVLMHLRPVSFRYKPEWSTNHKLQTGFIAQEIEDAVAECGADDWNITDINGEGIHCVKDGALISVLVACVQDLSREVAELKERLNG